MFYIIVRRTRNKHVSINANFRTHTHTQLAYCDYVMCWWNNDSFWLKFPYFNELVPKFPVVDQSSVRWNIVHLSLFFDNFKGITRTKRTIEFLLRKIIALSANRRRMNSHRKAVKYLGWPFSFSFSFSP